MAPIHTARRGTVNEGCPRATDVSPMSGSRRTAFSLVAISATTPVHQPPLGGYLWTQGNVHRPARLQRFLPFRPIGGLPARSAGMGRGDQSSRSRLLPVRAAAMITVGAGDAGNPDRRKDRRKRSSRERTWGGRHHWTCAVHQFQRTRLVPHGCGSRPRRRAVPINKLPVTLTQATPLARLQRRVSAALRRQRVTHQERRRPDRQVQARSRARSAGADLLSVLPTTC